MTTVTCRVPGLVLDTDAAVLPVNHEASDVVATLVAMALQPLISQQPDAPMTASGPQAGHWLPVPHGPVMPHTGH